MALGGRIERLPRDAVAAGGRVEHAAPLSEDPDVGRATIFALGEKRQIAVGDPAPIVAGVDGLAAIGLLIGVAGQPDPMQPEQPLHEPRAVEPLLRRSTPQIGQTHELRPVLENRPAALREPAGEELRGSHLTAGHPARDAIREDDLQEAAPGLGDFDDRPWTRSATGAAYGAGSRSARVPRAVTIQCPAGGRRSKSRARNASRSSGVRRTIDR